MVLVLTCLDMFLLFRSYNITCPSVTSIFLVLVNHSSAILYRKVSQSTVGGNDCRRTNARAKLGCLSIAKSISYVRCSFAMFASRKRKVKWVSLFLLTTFSSRWWRSLGMIVAYRHLPLAYRFSIHQPCLKTNAWKRRNCGSPWFLGCADTGDTVNHLAQACWFTVHV